MAVDCRPHFLLDSADDRQQTQQFNELCRLSLHSMTNCCRNPDQDPSQDRNNMVAIKVPRQGIALGL